jgi:low affinity Fe/Cu permease
MATTEHHQESGVGAIFDRMAGHVARWCGHAGAFVFAVVIVLVWLVSGPIFHFSDTWQLVINTGTTVLTFLMVFLIQNSINRDSMAVHLKLDELLRTTTEARNALIGAEELPERDITDLEEPNREVAQKPAAS